MPFLFGFNNKPLAFVHKISTDDSKVFASPPQVFLLSFITLREKMFLYEETVSTSALLSNIRNEDLEYTFSVLFFLPRNCLVLCTDKNKHRNKPTLILIWVGFALHKLLSHFQLYMVCHFHWLNLQKDFTSTRWCHPLSTYVKFSEKLRDWVMHEVGTKNFPKN